MELLDGLFPVRVNVGEEAFSSNLESAVKRDLPWLQASDAHNKVAIIVGGGPSLVDFEKQILFRKSMGHVIFALNNTAQWLVDRGIAPDYHVLLDARESTERFVLKNNETKCLIASQCHPSVFDKAENVTLWHPNIENIRSYIGDRVTALIGGGTTVGLQAMSIVYAMGFRDIHLFGMDSSYRGDSGHAYSQPENDGESVIKVQFAGKEFSCAPWMIRQTEEFKSVLKQLVDADCRISVMGDGFLPETFREMLRTTLTAVYDLSVSPPTYDFLSFLSEAEKARIKDGHEYLDIVFMPGPVRGFRDDDLPPAPEARESMLQRICVPACRLLKSVRNITVLKERKDISSEFVFPEKWTILAPTSHYGTSYLKDAIPCLTASSIAHDTVRRVFQKKYVTITMREASYWPERNSSKNDWAAVYNEIRRMGYDVFTVDDTSKTLSAFSWDIDLRLALYENAVCNLAVSNGPMALCYTSKAPYLVFKPVVESCPSTSESFLAAHNMKRGDSLGGNGKLVWEDDNASIVLEEFRKFIESTSNVDLHEA